MGGELLATMASSITRERSICAAGGCRARAAGRDRARIGRRRGRLTAGPAPTLGWLDGCGLFEPLDEGEFAYSSGVLVEQVAEVLRDLAVNAHPMVEGVVPEPRVPHRNDMLAVLNEPLFAEVGLVDLAVGFVLVEEPVVT